MSIDREKFYVAVRKTIFHAMTQAQVDGCNAILDEAEHRSLDLRFLAYMLATAFWETAQTMQPVREIGQGHGKAYGRLDPVTRKVYYGRGLVQLTWKANYAKMAAICLADLVNNPDQALQLDIAVKIMFKGMERGTFTGKKLSDYAHAEGFDYLGARHIINGTDKAAPIANVARKFYAALKFNYFGDKLNIK